MAKPQRGRGSREGEAPAEPMTGGWGRAQVRNERSEPPARRAFASIRHGRALPELVALGPAYVEHRAA